MSHFGMKVLGFFGVPIAASVAAITAGTAMVLATGGKNAVVNNRIVPVLGIASHVAGAACAYQYGYGSKSRKGSAARQAFARGGTWGEGIDLAVLMPAAYLVSTMAPETPQPPVTSGLGGLRNALRSMRR